MQLSTFQCLAIFKGACFTPTLFTKCLLPSIPGIYYPYNGSSFYFYGPATFPSLLASVLAQAVRYFHGFGQNIKQRRTQMSFQIPSSYICVCVCVCVCIPRWCSSGKESACQCRRCRFNPWVKKIPWRRAWLPTPVYLPGESHRQRHLAGYCPWGLTRLNTTEVT